MTTISGLSPLMYPNQMAGKLYVPVAPNQVVYSQFKHVSGYASRAADDGIAVDKVRVLNTLIDQLVTIKKQPEKQAGSRMTEQQINSLINDYQKQIKNALNTAKQYPYALTPTAPSASLFDIAA